MLAARVEQWQEPYAMSDERYEAVKRYLQSPEAKAMNQSDLERELRKHGHDLMRQLMQSYLDTRGPGEAVAPVRDAEGVERSERRFQTRALETECLNPTSAALLRRARGRGVLANEKLT